MTQRNLPGAGLDAFIDLGDPWKSEMDENLRITSFVIGGSVLSQTTDPLPGSPTLGDMYIMDSGAASNADAIALRDYEVDDVTEGWIYYTPKVGWTFYVVDTDIIMVWNGTAWVNINGVGGNPNVEDLGDVNLTSITDGDQLVWDDSESEWVNQPISGAVAYEANVKTANYTAVAGDFTGRRVIAFNSASNLTFTIPAGLTVTAPVHVTQRGVGTVTIVASSTTLHSKDSNLVVDGQYAMASILPEGTSDVYQVIGALTT